MKTCWPFIVLLASVGCSSGEEVVGSEAESGVELKIVASFGLLGEVAEEIGGDRVAVSTIVPLGSDPHRYSMSISDLQKVSDADLLFLAGLGLDGSLDRASDTVARFVATDALDEETLLPATDDHHHHHHDHDHHDHDHHDHAHQSGEHDPHFWGDPTLVAQVGLALAERLSELDPEGAEAYRSNAEDWAARMDELDRSVAETLAPFAGSRIATAHQAYGYFGRRYGLEKVGVQGVSSAAAASVSDVRDTASGLASGEIQAVFGERGVPAQTISAVMESARAKGWTGEFGGHLLPLPNSDHPTYAEAIRHNAQLIKDALD